jgi:ABC-2 type transport system ATP-binding protein
MKERVAGNVFEVDTADPVSVEQQLAANPAIRGFARLPGKIRFLLDRAAAGPVAASPLAVPGARAVLPQLEDIFTATVPASNAGLVVTARRAGPEQPSAAAPPPTTVNARGVTCRFGDFTAVDDVSLDLKAGEVFGFLGPNGAGKTTLIRILCGLQKFQSGAVTVAGVDVPRDAKSLRRRIGYMSQRFSLYADLSVMENLEFFAGVYELTATARDAALAWAMQSAGLQGLDSRKVREISGAVRQRLALACSVMHRPRVLFLDEPTSGVDPPSRHRFWRLVHDLAAQGITAFVTTHYLEEAAYCHRLGLMFQGRLISIGKLAELRAREGVAETASIEDLFLHSIERARTAA